MSFNWVDILVLALVGIPAAMGLKDGLVSGLLRGAGLVVFAALGVWKMAAIATWMARILGLSGAGAPLTVLALALLCGWLCGMAAAWAWKKFSAGAIGWTDRLAGGVFGAVKGTLVALAVLGGLTLLSAPARKAAQESWLGRHALGPMIESTRAWVDQRIRQWRTAP